MSAENYITANCIINKNIIYKNGKPLYENKVDGLLVFLNSVYGHFNMAYPKFFKMGNLSKLGWLTSEILLNEDPLKGRYLPNEIGIVISNSNASLDSDLKYYDSINEIPSPALFVYTLPSIMSGEISIRNNIKGENAFFISEYFDLKFIQHYVNNLLNDNKLKACICGWVELVEEEYNAVLFLVEKNKREPYNLFTMKSIQKILQE